MRKKTADILLLVLLLLVTCLAIPAAAEETTGDSVIDWSGYSYEELLGIREELDAYIQELERQYAIENGNRTITLNETEVTVYQKKTFAFEANITRIVDDAPESTELVWKSSDETIAKVSSAGVVTAVSYGDAVITCTAADDEYIFAEAVVHVALPVEKVTINDASATLLLSDQNPAAAEITLNYSIAPENAHIQEVTWSSANEAIATVDENGKVRAIAPGTVKITAVSKDETTKKSATCTVTVLQAVSSIDLDVTEITMNVRAKQNLVATVYPESASKKAVIWESSDPNVATVSSNGAVSAVGTGTATITCTATDGSEAVGKCNVTVIQMVTGLKIEAPSKSVTVNKNNSIKFKVTISPENASNKTLNWKSSDTSVVKVDSSGQITAVGGGVATVTCTAADGSGKSTEVEVFVPSISVDRSEYYVSSKDGLEITFKYFGKAQDLTFSPESGTYFNVWKRQNGEKVTLTIDPKKAGTGTITLTDKADRRSTVKISIHVEHSACYDSVSYPVGDYTSIMRKPSVYEGDKMSVYGRVLQVSEGLFSTTLRVATRGRWDNVFYITCYGDIASGVIEDDYITVYGECEGTETYTTIMGGSVTIPAIDAEKIFLGRN